MISSGSDRHRVERPDSTRPASQPLGLEVRRKDVRLRELLTERGFGVAKSSLPNMSARPPAGRTLAITSNPACCRSSLASASWVLAGVATTSSISSESDRHTSALCNQGQQLGHLPDRADQHLTIHGNERSERVAHQCVDEDLASFAIIPATSRFARPDIVVVTHQYCPPPPRQLRCRPPLRPLAGEHSDERTARRCVASRALMPVSFR